VHHWKRWDVKDISQYALEVFVFFKYFLPCYVTQKNLNRKRDQTSRQCNNNFLAFCKNAKLIILTHILTPSETELNQSCETATHVSYPHLEQSLCSQALMISIVLYMCCSLLRHSQTADSYCLLGHIWPRKSQRKKEKNQRKLLLLVLLYFWCLVF